MDELLEKEDLSLEEQQFIYDYLIDTRKEKWRYIKGYEGYYMINTYGLVLSCRPRNGDEKYLSPALNKGRFRVVLCVDGKPQATSVHKLVAETFIPNPNNRSYAKPKDGNYLNCEVRNLMWKESKTKKAISSKKSVSLCYV